MCNDDFMGDTIIEAWEFSCEEVSVWIGNGLTPIECESSDMEYLRSHCCENYVPGECNVIKKVFFFCDVRLS